MKKHTLYLVPLLFFVLNGIGQEPKRLLINCVKNIDKIESYSCNARFTFEIPGVKISPVDAKIFYKKPNKFKIKTKGIMFIPKQNQDEIYQLLRDTSAYFAVSIGKVNANIILQIIPKTTGNIQTARLSLNDKANIIESEITTKENGTVKFINQFGDATSNLPTETSVLFDVKKFKIPKMVSAELNAKKISDDIKSASTTAKLNVKYSNYIVNQPIPEAVFSEK